jgi:hypothetical protein
MIWTGYNINQGDNRFKVVGEWEGEAMGVGRDGNPKKGCLYRPGDVFVVNEDGWLIKQNR